MNQQKQVEKCQVRKPLINPDKVNRVNEQKSFSQQLPQIHKGMLSMNSSTIHKGNEIQKNCKLTDTDSTDITHYNLNYSSISNNKMFQVEHLELQYFKIYQCKSNQLHSHKHCPFYHNNKDRKRQGNFYSTELCEFLENNQICQFGDNCQKAHNRVEQLYRPDNYKTKFCTYYPNNIVNCDYGKFCSFAHSEEDISIELVHNYEYDDDFFMFYYKTVWCPFNLTQHDKALCVYAHNWQDFRRKPQVFQYQSIACLNWKTTDFITEYAEGCSESFNCLKCHGWKELEYHPLLFRTKQCLNQDCNKLDCSFFHSNQDRRLINQQSQLKIFKIVPRNRIIKNTFKVNQNISNLSNQSNQISKLSLSNEIDKPLYRSQQENDGYHGKEKKSIFAFHSDTDWLGKSIQNSSLCLDHDAKSDDDRQISKQKSHCHYEGLLVPIVERTDSDELRDIMRKRSYSKNLIEDQDNENNVRCVLNMIDLDN